jgi:hypothetical protein
LGYLSVSLLVNIYFITIDFKLETSENKAILNISNE